MNFKINSKVISINKVTFYLKSMKNKTIDFLSITKIKFEIIY